MSYEAFNFYTDLLLVFLSFNNDWVHLMLRVLVFIGYYPTRAEEGTPPEARTHQTSGGGVGHVTPPGGPGCSSGAFCFSGRP